jgi:hypothetical protein
MYLPLQPAEIVVDHWHYENWLEPAAGKEKVPVKIVVDIGTGHTCMGSIAAGREKVPVIR